MGTSTDTPKTPKVATGNVPDSELVISWGKVSGADYYKIERYRGDVGVNGAEVIAKKVKGTTYTDKGLTSNSKYWYKVYAVKTFEGYGNEDARGNKTFTSAASETVGKFTRISDPTITQSDSTPNKVVLKCTKAYGGNTYQYKVWRQSPTDKEFKRLTTTTDLTYTDNTLKSGNVYKYKIETVTKEGNHCTNTSEFYIAPKITTAPNVTPKSGTEMNVSWNKVASAGKVKYALIRKVNGKETTVATTTNTSYTDTKLTTNSTYSYYVKVQDASGKTLTTTPSATAVLQILPTKITLNKTATSLVEDATVQLTAAITPINTTSSGITWTSDDDNVASVTSGGLVTAKKEGTATITATTSNGKTTTATITVVKDACVFGEWITDKEPSCTEEGHKYRQCSKHGETEEAVIDANGHSYSEEMIETKEATCIDEGEKAYVCSVCGDKKDITTTEKNEHSFSDWIVDKAATCNESGLEYRECSECGFKETKDIEMTTHNYELTAETETTPDGPGSRTYTCSICGDTYTEVYVPEVAEGEIRIGSAAPRPGDTVTVPVKITENPGITGFELSLEYDKNALLPIEMTSGELLTSGLFMSTLDSGVSADELDVIKAVWSNDSAVTEDGELFTITFEILKDAEEGEHKIGLTYEKGCITDENFYDVMPSVVDNTITVADVLMGDVNQDRRVDSMDNILLTKKIAEFPGVIFNANQMKAANVHHDYDKNGDPYISIKDGVRLSQLLAGYQFETASAISLMSMENINISVENSEAYPGEYISIPITISNNTGVAGFKFILNYDSDVLTPMAISSGEILKDGMFASNFDEDTDVATLDALTVYWNSADSMMNDGTLFTVDFLVNENATVGQETAVNLVYNENDICDYTLATVGADIANGKIEMVAYTDEIDETTYDYYINDAYIDTEDSEESTFPATGNFDLTVAVQGEYDAEVEANMFVACYDETGKMLSIKDIALTEDILTAGSTVVHIDESKTDISDIKIFIWKANTLTPLALYYAL